MKLNVFYVFIFIILFHHYSFAQFKVIDSLRTVLSTAGEDTNKIRLLLLLGDEYGGINHDSSITIYEKAKKLSQKISYSKGVAISSGKIANEYVHKAEFYKAQENYEIALEINRQLKDSEDLADVYMDIGNLNSNGGLYNFPKALEAYNHSFIIWEQLGRKNKMADALSARGTLYNFIDDRQKSIEDLSKGLNIYIQLKDSNKSASNYLEIGRTYCWENKYDLAVENLNEAFRLFTLLHNEFGVNMCAFMNGVNNMNHGNFKKAIEYYEVSLNYFLKNSASFKHNLSINYDFLGRSYNRLKNYKKAIAYINEAIKFAKENNDLNAMLGAYADLTIAYEGQKEFSSALDAYKNFKLLHDSIEKINMGKEILRKEMQFDFVQKELTAKAEQNKKDALNLAEVKKQRIIRNSVSGGLAVVFLFSLVVYRQRSRISKEKKRSDELLLNILPGGVAEELKIKGFADAKQFDQVTVMFTDFKGFTQISEKLSPSELVAEIHTCFKAFDNIIGKHNIEKIKTIGDSYMCAGGLPVANKINATDVVSAALEIREFMQQHLQQRKSENKEPFEIRIGVHTGPVVAGIVGVKKFAYDIWGDTVNIASRMESSGEAGKVNISGSTYELVKDKFNCIHRGKIMAKNKGEIDMYFVEPGINH